MDNKRLLVIGLVWPEPSSSAAGSRIVQLIEVFLSAGYEVTFASAASKSEFSYPLTTLGVTERDILLNDGSFNVFAKEINPALVLFDRFVMEEQFGWRLRQECPDACTILDTEDLHCLRNARQQAVKIQNPSSEATQPELNLFTDMAKREIASILRCDLSLIISQSEMDILQQQFRIDPSLLYYLPFLEEALSIEETENWKSFEEREGFVFIGNYLHEPNWHTLQVLKTKIWPLLRKFLPKVNLHIYGAYAPQKVMQMHNVNERFIVHGRAANAREAISSHRVLLAPIQFGAGLKGKLIDAMQVGTPSVTTALGAEAMQGELDWNGAIIDDPDLFVNKAALLYEDEQMWSLAQQNGVQIINQRYHKALFVADFIEKTESLAANIKTHRQHNFIGQVLQHHTANSNKYMSLWIEEKSKSGIH
ncbi:glycosyltransferase family 4 protein [Pedobacter sp. MC2016-14]|uniref:glycosyltransferase n=1 Tax=Pedobacter sp. MC2016-14 TaxID=2897327 RepID=UPI001E3B3D76|nr:glycosyltransferase family 4 protein [Pedobacter sp. MC2016-14]MCD0489546.1 glycosyltransferase family 4 protein [Pedobacter sp. MC2016-14]